MKELSMKKHLILIALIPLALASCSRATIKPHEVQEAHSGSDSRSTSLIPSGLSIGVSSIHLTISKSGVETQYEIWLYDMYSLPNVPNRLIIEVDGQSMELIDPNPSGFADVYDVVFPTDRQTFERIAGAKRLKYTSKADKKTIDTITVRGQALSAHTTQLKRMLSDEELPSA
jgi:hypothetical protein